MPKNIQVQPNPLIDTLIVTTHHTKTLLTYAKLYLICLEAHWGFENKPNTRGKCLLIKRSFRISNMKMQPWLNRTTLMNEGLLAPG